MIQQVAGIEGPEWNGVAESLLFIQWVHRLAMEQLGLTQIGTSGIESRTSGLHDEYQFKNDSGAIRLTVDHGQWILAVDGNVDYNAAASILSAAQEAAERKDLGDGWCYGGDLVSPTPGALEQLSTPHQERLRQDQQRIVGTRRLGPMILEFAEDPPDPSNLFLAPTTSIAVKMLASGPGDGPLSARIAEGMLETARIVCSFALGRPVRHAGAYMAMAMADEESTATRARLADADMPGLARNGVYLDVGENLYALGGMEAVDKARGSLLAYDAALEQSNGDIAGLLMVSALEALAVPNAPWRTERATSRFIRATMDMAPATLNDLVADEDTGEIFNIRLAGGQNRRQRELLSKIYEMRSVNVHSGPAMMRVGMFSSLNSPATWRLPMLSKLYQEAFLTYLQGPRSYLIGMPGGDCSGGQRP